MVSSAAMNSSPVQGASRLGTRMSYVSSVERRAIMATAASHRPTE